MLICSEELFVEGDLMIDLGDVTKAYMSSI